MNRHCFAYQEPRALLFDKGSVQNTPILDIYYSYLNPVRVKIEEKKHIIKINPRIDLLRFYGF